MSGDGTRRQLALVVDSNYFGFVGDRLLAMQRFENFVDLVADQDIEEYDQHIRLQSKLIDLNSVDYIGRFEHFGEHLSEVTQIIGLDSVKIEQKNASRDESHYRQYYSARLREKVAAIYHRDINMFLYEFWRRWWI